MMAPFDLPEGMTWRELTVRDLDWLRAMNRTREGRAAVSIRVVIRHPDGREREYVDTGCPLEVETSLEKLMQSMTFQWTDGNYGCDCNRAKFFARAGGEPDPDVSCKNRNQYHIVSPQWLADRGTP